MNNLSSGQNRTVRNEVQALLAKSAAFQALPAEQRARVVDDTTAVAATLLEGRMANRDPYALAQAGEPGGEPGDTPRPGERWRPDDDFKAESIREGVAQVGTLLNEVNFPAFVSSLVQGTFQSIVDASIQQMHAYAELVQSVSTSLSEFRDQNVSVDEGRRHLQSKYPDVFNLGKDDDGLASLTFNDDLDFDAMPNFQADFGLEEPIDDLDDEETLDKLVVAARTELARGRQQLLATTILMGINRIIVTDGKINAKLLFTFSAKDSLDREGEFNEYARQKQSFEFGSTKAYLRGEFEKPVDLKVATVSGESESEIKAMGSLTGEVSINFRSETFPLERMVNTDQMAQLDAARSGNGRGVPATNPATGTPGATP